MGSRVKLPPLIVLAEPRPPRTDPELRAVLAETFPAAFPPEGVPPVPLKCGIDKDLYAAPRPLVVSLRSTRIHRFLYGWTQRPGYLAAMTAGRARVDLLGQAVGEVTPCQAATAIMELERRAIVRAEFAKNPMGWFTPDDTGSFA